MTCIKVLSHKSSENKDFDLFQKLKIKKRLISQNSDFHKTFTLRLFLTCSEFFTDFYASKKCNQAGHKFDEPNLSYSFLILVQFDG
ncbi:hypothetical protein BpHYR1_029821 [Brachionus plicatilis]|uniref:Uncharacterized protein n=1 Tax=Brachionus plicatilis TaxID=10195 RepID=A0A3M7S0T7_BRAPC|nr:hypothetical protein BpHYR1_029821 [Brachionus plicatilis]